MKGDLFFDRYVHPSTEHVNHLVFLGLPWLIVDSSLACVFCFFARLSHDVGAPDDIIEEDDDDDELDDAHSSISSRFRFLRLL